MIHYGIINVVPIPGGIQFDCDQYHAKEGNGEWLYPKDILSRFMLMSLKCLIPLLWFKRLCVFQLVELPCSNLELAGERLCISNVLRLCGKLSNVFL